MKPTSTLYRLAKSKALLLQPMQQIRLTSEPGIPWWVFKDRNGEMYIGVTTEDLVHGQPIPRFFLERPIYIFMRSSDEKVLAYVQKLF